VVSHRLSSSGNDDDDIPPDTSTIISAPPSTSASTSAKATTSMPVAHLQSPDKNASLMDKHRATPTERLEYQMDLTTMAVALSVAQQHLSFPQDALTWVDVQMVGLYAYISYLQKETYIVFSFLHETALYLLRTRSCTSCS